MKKILTMLLAAMLLAAMLLCAAACCAAESESIYLADVGEGCEAVLVVENPVTVSFLNDEVATGFVYAKVSREGLADVHIVIAKSEVAEGMSLADLGEEGMAILKNMVGEQYENPIIEEKTSPSGNLFIEVCSNEEESEIDTMLTIFEGYIITMDVYREDFSRLSEADKAFGEEMLYALWFNRTNE